MNKLCYLIIHEIIFELTTDCLPARDLSHTIKNESEDSIRISYLNEHNLSRAINVFRARSFGKCFRAKLCCVRQQAGANPDEFWRVGIVQLAAQQFCPALTLSSIPFSFIHLSDACSFGRVSTISNSTGACSVSQSASVRRAPPRAAPAWRSPRARRCAQHCGECALGPRARRSGSARAARADATRMLLR
jgi:hypothetical protein